MLSDEELMETTEDVIEDEVDESQEESEDVGEEVSEESTDGEQEDADEEESTDEEADQVDEKDNEPKVQKHKVKIYGEEKEVTTEDLIRGYQKAEGADKKFMETANRQKQIEELAQKITTTPIEALEKLGHSPKEMAIKIIDELGEDGQALIEDYILSKYEEENLTPEQKMLKEKDAELNKYRSQEEESKRIAQEAELQKQQEEMTEYFTKTINDELSKEENQDLPQTAQTLGRYAFYIEQANREGVELGMSQITTLIRDDYYKEISKVIEKIPPEVLEKEFPTLYKKVNKANIDKIKGKTSRTQTASVKPRKSDKKPRMNWDDFEKEVLNPMMNS